MNTPYKTIPPSITATAFNCPHCGVLTSQRWYEVHLSKVHDEIPHVWNEELRAALVQREDVSEMRSEALRIIDRCIAGEVFAAQGSGKHLNETAPSLFLSECRECSKMAIWIQDRMLFPPQRLGLPPSNDLPSDVRRDYEEAQIILGQSPRGACALLRLAVQKLCDHLGESGKSLDAGIADLVQKGLDPVIRMALDIVRVIGNEAVHPGTMDLRDDAATAERLFELVNLIAEQMIGRPARVQEMYSRLPENKRAAIERRDGAK